MKPLFILGINASPFTDVAEHNTARLVNTALSAAENTGAEVELIHLGQIPHDDGRRDEERYRLKRRIRMLPKDGKLRSIVRKILHADGIIFGTPTRNFTASSRMLALMSWLQITTDAPDYALAGKVGAFMSACEEDGGQSANEKMFSPTNHMGIAIPPFGSYFYNKYAQESEGDWQETDITLTGMNVRRMCQVLRGELTPPPGGFTAEMWNDETDSW